MPIFLAAAIVVVIVYFFVIKRNAANTLSEDEVALLRHCFNDAAQMERLTTFEQRRSPSETRAQAVRSAIQSLKY